MAASCSVEFLKGRLICYLPVTMPTGKVRVKRHGYPVATRSFPCGREDIVEWQISYFADGHLKMIELAKLLELAYHNNLIEKEELQQLLNEIKKNQEFFAEKYSISINNSGLTEDFHGFKVLKKKVPILQKSIEGVKIWIELGHKQRAVGFQPMLYLHIPINSVSPNLVGKTAQKKQIVEWEPSMPILFGVVKAFSIASRKHYKDMIDVLEFIIKR